MCAAPFCEPKRRDFGFASYGQRGFGGVMEDPLNRSPLGQPNFLPQYNLEAFWRRQLPPYVDRLPQPLIEPRFRKEELSRIPGAISWSTGRTQLDNRNLLCATTVENDVGDRTMRVWTVSERSKQNFMERFDVNILKETPNVSSLTSYTVPSTKRNGWKFKDRVIQLKMAEYMNEEHEGVFIRCEESLQLLLGEDGEEKIVRVFKDRVRTFAENPHLPGELAISDHSGMLWIKDFNTEDMMNMRRVKPPKDRPEEFLHSLTYTDHPRTLAACSNTYVRTVDLRENGHRNRGIILFELPKFDSQRHEDARKIPLKVSRSPRLRHLFSIPTKPHHFMTVNAHAFYLIDDRFPGTPMLTLNHSIAQGGHVWQAGRPYKDSTGRGEVAALYCLDQLITEMTWSKIYFHSCGLVSSTNMMRSLPKPADYDSMTSRVGVEHNQCLQEQARSFSLLQMDHQDLLLVQNDDGGVWWHRIDHDHPPTATHPDAIDTIEDYIDRHEKNPIYLSHLPDQLMNAPEKRIEKLQIDIEGATEVEVRRAADNAVREAVGCRHWDPEPDVTNTEPSDLQDLSKCLEVIWSKVADD